MILTGPTPVPMLSLRLPVWRGYHFTPGVTVDEALALRAALDGTGTTGDITVEVHGRRLTERTPRTRADSDLDRALAENRATPSIRPNGCDSCDGFGGTGEFPCGTCGGTDPDDNGDDARDPDDDYFEDDDPDEWGDLEIRLDWLFDATRPEQAKDAARALARMEGAAARIAQRTRDAVSVAERNHAGRGK